MHWEYMVVNVKAGMLEPDDPLEVGSNGGTVGRDKLNSALNSLGAESWEGFSTTFDGKGIVTSVLLKRQK